MLPGLHSFATTTGREVHFNSLNATEFAECLARFFDRRCRGPSSALPSCTYVDDSRSSATWILVGFVGDENIDHSPIPLAAPLNRQQRSFGTLNFQNTHLDAPKGTVPLAGAILSQPIDFVGT